MRLGGINRPWRDAANSSQSWYDSISMKYIARFLAAVFLSLACTVPALAHPHVWVTVTSQIVYAADGSATGVRQSWIFDEGYSAFATTGLPHKTAGAFTREELAELTKEVVTNLKDSDYYTYAKADGKDLEFRAPVDYWQEYKKESLTLHFTLLFASPVKAKDLSIEVYDPTYYIDFAFADKDPVALISAPAQCKLSLHKPKGVSMTQGPALSDAAAASGNWGVNFASKIAVACP